MKRFRVLLLTPPMVQFNTPYAATPLLTAFLRQQGVITRQADLACDLALRLFSPDGLDRLRKALRVSGIRTPATSFFLARFDEYRRTIGPAIRFLQGRSPGRAEKIVRRSFFPEGRRFHVLNDLATAGLAPFQKDPASMARYLASLYLDDLGDVLSDATGGDFGLARYAERLAAVAPSFTPLLRKLRAPPTFADRILDERVADLLRTFRPDLVGLTLPFPGTVYGGFRIAQTLRRLAPAVRIAAGGGYVSTELRSLTDPRVFEFLDFLLFDDGEQPLLRLIQHLRGDEPK
ncbi:MAG: radical SAM protein, partial [Kiritimatiellia bacterium]|nr:radical SAM protein [Kiritimatiellia bacterium]